MRRGAPSSGDGHIASGDWFDAHAANLLFGAGQCQNFLEEAQVLDEAQNVAVDPTAADLHQTENVMEAGLGPCLPELLKCFGVRAQGKTPGRLAAGAFDDRNDVTLFKRQVEFAAIRLRSGQSRRTSRPRRSRCGVASRRVWICLKVSITLSLPCVHVLTRCCHESRLSTPCQQEVWVNTLRCGVAEDMRQKVSSIARTKTIISLARYHPIPLRALGICGHFGEVCYGDERQ